MGIGGLQAPGLNRNFQYFRNYSLMPAEEKLLIKTEDADKLAGVQWQATRAVGSCRHLPGAHAPELLAPGAPFRGAGSH